MTDDEYRRLITDLRVDVESLYQQVTKTAAQRDALYRACLCALDLFEEDDDDRTAEPLTVREQAIRKRLEVGIAPMDEAVRKAGKVVDKGEGSDARS